MTDRQPILGLGIAVTTRKVIVALAIVTVIGASCMDSDADHVASSSSDVVAPTWIAKFGECSSTSQDEVASWASFPILWPDDLPEGLVIDGVLVKRAAELEPVGCENGDWVEFSLSKPGSDKASPWHIWLFQRTLFTEIGGDVSRTVVEIDGMEVTRYETKAGENVVLSYQWEIDGVQFQVTGAALPVVRDQEVVVLEALIRSLLEQGGGSS